METSHLYKVRRSNLGWLKSSYSSLAPTVESLSFTVYDDVCAEFHTRSLFSDSAMKVSILDVLREHLGASAGPIISTEV